MSAPKVTTSMCKTPSPVPDDYDWRLEPWADDTKIRALAMYIAHHVLTALAIDRAGELKDEDAQVYFLLHPQRTELIWKSPISNEALRHRIVCAAAIGIDTMITQWMKMLGDIDSPGMPQKPPQPLSN